MSNSIFKECISLKKRTLKFIIFLSILLIISGLNAGDNESFILRGNELLHQYQPDIERTSESQITPEESWIQYYQNMNNRDPLVVATMPSNSVNTAYGNAKINEPIAIWGSATGGTIPYLWTLFINDIEVASDSTNNGRYLGIEHTFTYAGLKTIRLEVTDSERNFASHESVVRVHPSLNQTLEVNMAIEKGLLFSYLNATIYSDDYIYWSQNNSNNGTAETGLCVLAFEENGHIPINDYQDDIYAETSRMGLNHLLSQGTTYSGHAYLRNNQYANGIAWLAVIMAHPDAVSAQSDIIDIGAFTGMSFYDLVQSGIDLYELNQGNSGEWHYSVATTNSSGYDGSCQQWPIFVMKAAEDRWGIFAPETTHNMAMTAYAAITNANGACGYGSSNQYLNSAKTGGMLVGYVWDGKLQELGDADAIQSINYLGSQWYNLGHQTSYTGWVADFYSMYGVKKGLELQNIDTISTSNGERYWYDDMVDWLLGHDTDFTTSANINGYRSTTYAFGQQSNGAWRSDLGYVASHGPAYEYLDTAHAILVLTKAVTTISPIAIIVDVNDQPTNTPFQMNGSSSYHPDPERSIVQWLWDWDASDGLDWINPDGVGQQPTNPGYTNEGDFVITLRVKDDNDPPRYDTESTIVSLTLDNHPPVAVAIPDSLLPSYAGIVNEPISLIGSQSYDPDPEDSIIEWSWDTDGNGEFGDAFGEVVDVIFPGEYVGSIGLLVTSSDGTTGTSSAYVDIAFSGSDIAVTDFSSSRLLDGMTSVDLHVEFNNDLNSINDAFNILVNFYDDNPFTIGQRVGDSYYVDIPIGQTVYLDLTTEIPLGLDIIYVLLDANGNFSESDELNNLLSVDILYGFAEEDSFSTNEDTPFEFNVLDNDYQGDGDLTILSITQPVSGVAEIIDADLGIVSYTANEQHFNGIDSFTYSINTPVGNDPDSHFVNITITPVNDPPVCTTPPEIFGDILIGSEITSTDGIWDDIIDDDGNVVSLAYQWQSADDELFSENIEDLAGANANSYILTQSEKEKYFRLKITGTDDGTPLPGESSDAFSNVLFVENNLPEIDEGDQISLNTDEDVILEFSLSVTDLDSDEIFQWIIVAPPNLGSIDFLDIIRTSTEMKYINYTPNQDVYGEDTFVLGVSDGVDSDYITIEMTINSINDAPVINFPENFTFNEDEIATYDFSEYISDVDNTLDDISVSWEGNTNIQIDLTGWDITFSSLIENWFGQEDITFHFNDNSNLLRSSSSSISGLSMVKNSKDIQKNQAKLRDEVSQTITVYCEPLNDAPTIDLPDSFSLPEDTELVVDFEQYISDIDSDNLTLSVTGNDNISVDIVTYLVTFDPADDWFGSETLEFTIDDNFARAVDFDNVLIEVTPINDEPILIDYSPEELSITIYQNNSLDFNVNAEDIDSVIEYNWYIDNEIQPETSSDFSYNFTELGEFDIKSIISDEEFNIETIWDITVEEDVEALEDILPVHTRLYQNVPNPFNPNTTIRYQLAETNHVTIDIFNIRGERINRLKDDVLQPGYYENIWSGDDFSGKDISSGIYFIRLKTDTKESIIKSLLLK